ncbi:M48 family metallopeptidase [Anaerotignum sp.]
MTWNMEATANTAYETENSRSRKREFLHKALTVAKKAILPEQAEKNIMVYSHPVDAVQVRILDNPVINTVFKSLIDTAVDAKYGTVLSSGIPVNEKTFPELNEIVEHCVEMLQIRRPYVVVSGAVGFNAITMGSDEEPYIVLGNHLVSALTKEQLSFVIGHECGHVAMGHVVYHTAANVVGTMANAIPVVGPVAYNSACIAIKAWSRRSEITADRAGLLCCGDMEIAKKTLMQLELGFVQVEGLDADNYVESSQNYRKAGVLRRIGEYTASHPILPKRIQALDVFENSECYYLARNMVPPTGVMTAAELMKAVEEQIRVL